jgi:hypothetical protein
VSGTPTGFGTDRPSRPPSVPIRAGHSPRHRFAGAKRTLEGAQYPTARPIWCAGISASVWHSHRFRHRSTLVDPHPYPSAPVTRPDTGSPRPKEPLRELNTLPPGPSGVPESGPVATTPTGFGTDRPSSTPIRTHPRQTGRKYSSQFPLAFTSTRTGRKQRPQPPPSRTCHWARHPKPVKTDRGGWSVCCGGIVRNCMGIAWPEFHAGGAHGFWL